MFNHFFWDNIHWLTKLKREVGEILFTYIILSVRSERIHEKFIKSYSTDVGGVPGCVLCVFCRWRFSVFWPTGERLPFTWFLLFRNLPFDSIIFLFEMFYMRFIKILVPFHWFQKLNYFFFMSMDRMIFAFIVFILFYHRTKL